MVSSRSQDPSIDGCAGTAIRLLDELDLIPERRLDLIATTVRGAIIDHDYFERSRLFGQNTSDRLPDEAGLIEDRNDDGYGRA